MKIALALVAASVLSIVSCGRSDSRSNLDSAAASQSYSFVRDMRPVDGLLLNVTFTQQVDMKWRIEISKTGRVATPAVTTVDDLTCKITNFQAGLTVSSMDCRFDARPVDGGLTQFIVTRTEAGTYKITNINSYYDRVHGKEVTTSTIIGTKMIQANRI